MPYKLRSDHPDRANAHLRALYAAAAIPAEAAGYVPGGPRPVVVEHHPGCPPSHPHGITDEGGHLLACHATPEEARAIAEKLDLSDPSGEGGSATAAARGGFDPLKHPRIEHGPGGGEFTHGPGGGGTRQPAEPPRPQAPELIGHELWSSGEGAAPPATPEQVQAVARVWYDTHATSTNSWLRTGEYRGQPPTAQFQGDVRTFAGLINASKPFTRPALMWRATYGGNRLFGPPGTAKGKIFSDKGLVSLSASEETVHSYGDTMIRVHVPPGARAMHADQAMWSAAGNDSYRPMGTVQEFTLAPGSRWEVTDDQPYHSMFGGYRVLDVNLLPPAAAGEPAPRAAAPSRTAHTPDGDLPGGSDRFAWKPGDVEFSTAAAAVVFDPLKHPRIEHGHGGGEFTHSPGGGAAPGHLGDGITDPPPTDALTFNGRFTLAGAGPADPLLTKVNGKLTHPLIGTGPNKGKVRRPAVPAYHESVARISAEITRLIAEQGTLEDGRKWYPDEHAMNHRRAAAFHVPIQTAIGVEAATCPRVQWLVNQRVTNELLDEVPKTGKTAEDIKKAHHLGGGVYNSMRDDGVDIILGAPVAKVLGGTKRRNFYNNIMWPGQTDSVTIDTWMIQGLKALGLDDDQADALGSQSQAGLADGIGKVLIADATRDATTRLRGQGQDVTPDAVQAAYWIALQKARGLSDPTSHANPRDAGYMHAAAPGGPGDPDALTDAQWDAELLIQYLTWLGEDVPPPRVDLGPPGSARLQGGLAADNPAAWKITLADPRFRRLGMTTAQAEQAARGTTPPAGPAAAGPYATLAALGADPAALAAAANPAGPFTVRENHPACPPHAPHAAVHSGTGEIAGCRRTKGQAQTLALTLNIPDAAPAPGTPPGDMPAVTAREFVRDEHGRFAHVPGTSAPRPRTRRRPPATRPARPPGSAVPRHPPGGETQTTLITPESERRFAAAIAKDEADLQVAAATKKLEEQQHLALKETLAELERTHAQIAEAERQQEKGDEHKKLIRKLIHHVFALVGVVLVGWINYKLGTPDVLAGVTEASPLFIQEAADFIKRV